jgi:hypothetical protein
LRANASVLQALPALPLARLVLLLVALFVVGGPCANGQTSQASIRGNVHDATNAVIPNATLSLMNTETRVVSTAKTNATGDYLFLNITPGTYTLEAKSTGFTAVKLTPFTLQVNQTPVLDFSLAPGQVDQVISVEATGEELQAASSELGLTLESKQITDLPLDTRNFTELFGTAPGVSPIVVGGSQTNSYTTSIGPVAIPSFNGQTNRSDIFVVDGILDIETFGNSYAVQPSIETIQDLKLQSHNDSAEFGGSTGGTINVATKSGTNTLHGSAWEYNKSPSLQAVYYFTPPNTPVAPFKQNQFGGTLGGPVVIPKLYNGRDKTFFFAGYEDFRFSGPGTATYLVPTAAELSGDFTADAPIYDPTTTTCTASGNCTRQQFSYMGVKNVIDPTRLNQGLITYAKDVFPPISTTPVGGGNNAYQSAPNVQDLYTYDGRVDETIGQKNSAFFRIMGIRGNQTSGRTQLPGTTQTNGYSYVGSYEHIFSPTSVLHVQAGKTYEARNFVQVYNNVPANLASTVGFPSGLDSGFVTLGKILPGFGIDGHIGELGDYANPETTANSYSIKGDYTKVLGRHTLKTGLEYNGIGESQDIEFAQEVMRAQETNSLNDGAAGFPQVSGNAVASFVLGIPGSFTKRNVQESLSPGGLLSWYVQDQFQVTRKLTLNVGIRYDLALIPKYGTPSQNNQAVGDFDFNNGTYIVYKVPGPCSTLGTAPCIPTAGGVLPDHVVASSDGKVLENQYNNAQPRLGAAYLINSTTVLRGGIGLAFDNYAGLVQNLRGVSGNWPSVAQIAQSNINSPTPAAPFPGYTVSNLPALTTLPSPTPFNQFNWFIDPNLKDAYSLQYNLGVQKQLGAATTASATYVGSVNRRLNVGGYWNVALTPGPGTPSLRAPYPYIAPTFYSRSNGNGDYNALQMQLVRRFNKGLAATIAYTFSKSIDEGCSGFFGTEGCSVQQIYDIKAERSVAAFDVPQNFVATWNYQLPIGRGKAINIENRALDIIAGGWQYSGFARFHSGTPYTVNLNADIANIGNSGYERPNIVGSTTPANRGKNDWLNAAGFAVPTQYTYGNEGRNRFRTEFSKDFDMSLFKEVQIERFHLRVAADAFNIFNHPIFGQPDSTLGDQNFGIISGTNSEARTVQLSGKVTF